MAILGSCQPKVLKRRGKKGDFLTRRISGASKARVEEVFPARVIMNYVIASALKLLSTFCFFIGQGR